MVQDPVQHRGGKHRISHHLCPVNDLFVGGKDDGTGFIGVADKCEKTIRLSAADRSVANLINDDKLGFLDIFEPETGGALCLCGVEDLDQAGHLLKTSAVSRILIRLVIFSKHEACFDTVRLLKKRGKVLELDCSKIFWIACKNSEAVFQYCHPDGTMEIIKVEV